MLAGQQKKDAVTKLMDQLLADYRTASLSDKEREVLLGQLKAYGRDPSNAEALLSRTGIATLAEYGFGHYPVTTCREAFRCIANALLLVPKLRQDFVDLEFSRKAAENLRVQDDEDEFLMARILFLLTYDTQVDLETLITDCDLGISIGKHLERHANLLSHRKGISTVNSMETMAMNESLKLLFNLSNAFPERPALFSASIRPLLDILQSLPISKPPLQPPLNYAINALANLGLPKWDTATAADDPAAVPFSNYLVDKLVAILDSTITSYEAPQLETVSIPLLTVLRNMENAVPPDCRRAMQEKLLPLQKNRDLPIGQGDDLPSRLLRLTTSSGMVNLSQSISGLMFDLSDKDANKYVANVGYGFAAGYLVSHNIPVPSNPNNNPSDPSVAQVPINPVTGQRADKENYDHGLEMTQEEKEREAERLFVLFERLRATGVMDVTNPVQQAVETGKFSQRIEEIDDSD